VIFVLTPNPALDITYTLPHVTAGEAHRVHDVAQRAGGKGLNVARVLAALGHEVDVGGFLGGGPGRELRRLLAGSSGLRQDWVEVDADARRTVTVVHDGVATAFNEAGRPVGPESWARLAAQVRERAGSGDVVVVSGSTPPGTQPEEFAAVITAAREGGARTVVDTSGPLLLVAARAGADVLKPNAEELAGATGEMDVLAGTEVLLSAGAGAVVLSRGEDGMLLALPSTGGLRLWTARPAERLEGNPTGAGDAAVAALTQALARAPGVSLAEVLPEALRDAVALSGAAVLRPVAGEVDLPAYERMRTEITVES